MLGGKAFVWITQHSPGCSLASLLRQPSCVDYASEDGELSGAFSAEMQPQVWSQISLKQPTTTALSSVGYQGFCG